MFSLLNSAFGPDPERDRLRQQEIEATERLRSAINDLADQIQRGENVPVSSIDLLQSVLEPLKGGDIKETLRRFLFDENGNFNRQTGGALLQLDKAFGTDFFKQFGEIDQSNLGALQRFFERLQEFVDAASAGFGTFGDSLEAQIEFFNLLKDQLDIGDATQALQLFLDEVQAIPDALKEALAGFDLSSAEGRKAASDFLAELTGTLAREGITDQIRAIFGSDLTPGEILKLLDSLDGLLDNLDQQAKDSAETQSYVRSVQITEAQAGRLLALNTTMVSRLERLDVLAVERNALLTTLLGSALAGAAPIPTSSSSNISLGGVQVPVTSAPITDQQSAASYGNAVGNAVMDQIDRRFYDRQVNAKRTLGSG